MYSVEITVEKDRVTGETKVLSSTTMLPQNHCLQGVKVYEDELKGTGQPTPLAAGRSRGQGTREQPPEHPSGHPEG